MKILVATEKPFASVAVKKMREVSEQAGHVMNLLENYGNISDLKAAVADADALIVRSDLVTAEVLDAAPKLKIVVRAGAGDSIVRHHRNDRNRNTHLRRR